MDPAHVRIENHGSTAQSDQLITLVLYHNATLHMELRFSGLVSHEYFSRDLAHTIRSRELSDTREKIFCHPSSASTFVSKRRCEIMRSLKFNLRS